MAKSKDGAGAQESNLVLEGSETPVRPYTLLARSYTLAGALEPQGLTLPGE
jgi:hypothetical protein